MLGFNESCLPLTWVVDFAKKKTEGEKNVKFIEILAFLSLSLAMLDSSLVRGSRLTPQYLIKNSKILENPLFMRFFDYLKYLPSSPSNALP